LRDQAESPLNITDEMQDTQRRLNSLATALQALAPGDPERTPIIQEMIGDFRYNPPQRFNTGGSAPAQPTAQPAATPTPARPTRVTQASSSWTTMSKLPAFFKDKEARQEWADFIMEELNQEALKRVYAGADTAALKEARDIISKFQKAGAVVHTQEGAQDHRGRSVVHNRGSSIYSLVFNYHGLQRN